jgi:hypothetical protein
MGSGAVTHFWLYRWGWRKEHEDALKEFAQAQEEYDLKRQAWKEQYKANTKRNKTIPNRPDAVPGEPTLRRLIVNDAHL